MLAGPEHRVHSVTVENAGPLQAIQREQQMREKDPADLIFDVLDMDKDGQLTKGEFRAQTTDTFAFAGPRLTGRFGSNSGRNGRAEMRQRGAR